MLGIAIALLGLPAADAQPAPGLPVAVTTALPTPTPAGVVVHFEVMPATAPVVVTYQWGVVSVAADCAARCPTPAGDAALPATRLGEGAACAPSQPSSAATAPGTFHVGPDCFFETRDLGGAAVQPAQGRIVVQWLEQPLDLVVTPGAPVAVQAFLASEALDGPLADAGPQPTFVVGLALPHQPTWLVLPLGVQYAPPAAAFRTTGATSPLPDTLAGWLAGMGLAGGGLAWLAKARDPALTWPTPPLRYTRLRRAQLLDHATRRRVFEAIQAAPGIRYQALAARTGLPAGVLTHHLRVLADHGFVADERRGRQRHLYASGATPSAAERALADQPARILALLTTQALSQRDLAARLGMTPQGVAYHMDKLREAGRIVRERGPDGTWVYGAALPAATPRARNAPPARDARGL